MTKKKKQHFYSLNHDDDVFTVFTPTFIFFARSQIFGEDPLISATTNYSIEKKTSFVLGAN